jgi:hypothetical protein
LERVGTQWLKLLKDLGLDIPNDPTDKH